MRYLPPFILFIFFSIHITADASSLIVPSSSVKPGTGNRLLPDKEIIGLLFRLKPQEIIKLTGKKFSLKEKLALIILRHKLKKQQLHPGKNKDRDNGKTAFILGLAGLICLFIPFLDLASIPLAILAIVIGSKARKEGQCNRKAMTGIILGIITLGLLLVIGLTVAIVLTIGSVPR
jgi:hypothetical protein